MANAVKEAAGFLGGDIQCVYSDLKVRRVGASLFYCVATFKVTRIRFSLKDESNPHGYRSIFSTSSSDRRGTTLPGILEPSDKL